MKLRNIVYIVGCGFLLASCSENFLSHDPQNGTLLEDQFARMDDALEGSARSLYSVLYEYGGDHDSFGQRSLDMYGDLTSGDMAMTSAGYGWFEVDERGQSYAYRAAGTWYYYYRIIRLCNTVISAIDKVGTPALPAEKNNLGNGYYYGEMLAMRGWAYAGLMRYFVAPSDLIDDMSKEQAVPLYTEVEFSDKDLLGAPRAYASEVYARIEDDLKLAIDYLDAYNTAGFDRASKLEVNADVARLILAYAYINKGGKESYDKAYDLAKAVIEAKHFTILPNSKLLTTGFSDVSEPSWMWGQDVTVENTTALGSFFGQVDVHTYSYAAAGDVKGIDEALYNQIKKMGWDGRVNWFNEKRKYAPEGKFYNVSTKNTTNLNEVDRNWLCDNVFMRIELAYLIAAEAALNKTTPDLAEALSCLDAIMSQRLADNADAQDLYNDYKTTLTTADALHDALVYNWRVELWGEGYAMQTVRRLTHTQALGTNHMGGGKQVDYSTIQFTWRIPASETRYNPYIKEDQLAEDSK